MFFSVTHKDSQTAARTGVIRTAHGDVETPTFMPVGTQATVKTQTPEEVKEAGANIILANTYHLHLRPGDDLIANVGGLHKFMKWDGPMLTDSGGFQVFSLGAQKEKNDQGKLVKIDEEGVTFHSHIDGKRMRFTPEKAIDIQHNLGADIIMAFDECTPGDADETYARQAMERTHRWAKQSLDAHKKETAKHGYEQYLFGIIQGAEHEDLRTESAKTISAMDFDGIAIGGESIGYDMDATEKILSWVMPHIPDDKPHYTMGVGSNPTDFFRVVEHGIDMFDCVAPTRIARTGTLYSKDAKDNRYRVNIKNAAYKNDHAPVDSTCDCPVCQTYTRAYIHHLFDAKEILGHRLATQHNLHFLLDLMKDMREAIKEDRFLDLKKEWMG